MTLARTAAVLICVSAVLLCIAVWKQTWLMGLTDALLIFANVCAYKNAKCNERLTSKLDEMERDLMERDYQRSRDW